MMSPLSDIYLVTERLIQVPTQALDALATSLGLLLPSGYREYLTRLGIGNYSGFLHVHSPEQVKKDVKYWQETGVEILAETRSKSVLSAKKLRESVLFGH